jgi:UDP-2,3-diacylglucosamine pyrophosphatase LpxH
MTLKIYTDVHLFSPMYDNTKLNDVEESYFIGDVIDFANCKKDELGKAQITYSALKHRAKGWVDGNHEATSVNNEIIIVANTLMVHGDFESWGEKKAMKYRTKSHGAGFFKRQMWVKALRGFEKMYSPKPSKKMLKRMLEMAKKHKVKTVICGHLHPHKTYDRVFGGVRMIVLKRGYNEIEV